jgi:hypothetical protein
LKTPTRNILADSRFPFQSSPTWEHVVALDSKTESQSSFKALASSWRAAKVFWIFLAFLSVSAQRSWSQIDYAVTLPPTLGIFATAGGGNTQLPYYADNALGFNFGVFLQPSAMLGAEIRGGTYPVKAQFTQSPITAGLRIARVSSDATWLPFAYFGGGFSRSQDSGVTFLPMPATWAPCWEASVGVDLPLGRFSWRAAEVSWVETYAPRQTLRTPYLSTGIAYRFRR